MFTNLISQALTAAQKTTITNSINDMKLIFTWLLNLTPDDRKKLLKMGDKSVGFVRGVLQALQANPSVVPSTFDVAEFQKDVTLWDDLQAIILLLRPLFEGLDDTLLALGNEMMQQANAGYKLLQEAAKTNSSLTSTVQDLGKRYDKAGRTPVSAIAIPAQGKVTLNGVVPLRKAKALSGGPYTIYKGAVTGGESRTLGIGSPLQIPSGWNVITVVNMSNDLGMLTIIQK